MSDYNLTRVYADGAHESEAFTSRTRLQIALYEDGLNSDQILQLLDSGRLTAHDRRGDAETEYQLRGGK